MRKLPLSVDTSGGLSEATRGSLDAISGIRRTLKARVVLPVELRGHFKSMEGPQSGEGDAQGSPGKPLLSRDLYHTGVCTPRQAGDKLGLTEISGELGIHLHRCGRSWALRG